MGYSARYHAASLAAVFIALAVGILIGVGFGSDVVTGTADDLQESLSADLDEARERVDELERELAEEREFGEAIYPTVVAGSLRGERIALIGLGGLSQAITADVEAALEPTGARVGEIAVIDEPPSLDELGSTLSGRRARELARGDANAIDDFSTEAGRLLVVGGPRFDELRGTLIGRYSGQPRGTDAVVLVRQQPEGLSAEETEITDRLEQGVVAGLLSTGRPVVGVEQTTTEPSTIGFYAPSGTSTVDDVDRVAGKVALVFALAGAQGNFGVKETADSLLPEVLTRPVAP